MSTRRRFFGQLAAGAGAVAGLDQLLSACSAFDRGLPQDPVSFDKLRADYLLDPEITYLNHASIGTIPRIVHEARAGYLKACESNPWLHVWGGIWDEARERTRALAAEVLGCGAEDVAITHNTTEGFNLLAAGLPIGSGDEVLFSNFNHAGASQCWEHAAARRGYSVRKFSLPLQGVPELSEDAIVEAHLRELRGATVLVLPHIDNMVGLRLPVRRIAAAAREQGVRFVLVDGAQAVGMIPVDVGSLGVDAYATSPHKWLQAPKGLGLVYLSAELRDVVSPLWVTWGQERWKGTVRIFEDYGTRDLSAVLALGDAIEFQQRLGEQRAAARRRALWSAFRERVEGEPKVHWRSPGSWELGASLYAIEAEGVDSREAFEVMWKQNGFVTRPFHAAGLNTLRISPNAASTEAEFDRFFDALRRDVLG